MTKPLVHDRWRFAAIAAVLALVAPHSALAAVGGGGGGVFSGLLSWIQANVVTDLITLAIIAAGVLMMWMRLQPMLVLAICAGAWIVLNAQTIQGFL